MMVVDEHDDKDTLMANPKTDPNHILKVLIEDLDSTFSATGDVSSVLSDLMDTRPSPNAFLLGLWVDLGFESTCPEAPEGLTPWERTEIQRLWQNVQAGINVLARQLAEITRGTEIPLIVQQAADIHTHQVALHTMIRGAHHRQAREERIVGSR